MFHGRGIYRIEVRAVNAPGSGQVPEAVEVRMPLDPAYWSNFRAGDLEGTRLMLDAFLSGGSSLDREVRFGEALRFEEEENHCNVDRIWEEWMRRHGQIFEPGRNRGQQGHRIDRQMVDVIGDALTPDRTLDPLHLPPMSSSPPASQSPYSMAGR